jgi:hypothetical protein
VNTCHSLIFLDIDGVLNGHEYDPEIMCGEIHRDKVQLLNHILRQTGAKVVLSSAWRYIIHRREATLAGMDWLLRSHGMLANRLIGCTREDTMRTDPNYSGTPNSWPVHDESGQQITDWLQQNGLPETRYIAIDDLDLGITDSGHPLVLTDGKKGLTAGDATKAIRILQGGAEDFPP